jgi:hypothetical protein
MAKREPPADCNSLVSRLAETGMTVREIEVSEAEWREAVIELARAQRVYAEIAARPDAPDVLVNRAWLVLWRAERLIHVGSRSDMQPTSAARIARVQSRGLGLEQDVRRSVRIAVPGYFPLP